MEEKLWQLLQQEGFVSMKSNHPWLYGFVRRERSSLSLIQVIGETDEIEINAENYRKLQTEIEEALNRNETWTIHHLTLLVTADEQHGLEVTAGDNSSWLVNPDTEEIMVPEGKAEDFYGLRKVLERLPQYQPEREAASVRGETLPVKRSGPVPFVTLMLTAVNILIYMLLKEDSPFYSRGAISLRCLQNQGEYYRLFTAMFLHGGIDHLMNNMLWLVCAGFMLEKAIGHIRFLGLYLLSGLAGNLVSCLYEGVTGDYFLSVGASGAIFGLIGAIIYLMMKKDRRAGRISVLQLLIMTGLLLYSGFIEPAVNEWAHVGGFAAGILLMWIGTLLQKRKAGEDHGEGK